MFVNGLRFYYNIQPFKKMSEIKLIILQKPLIQSKNCIVKNKIAHKETPMYILKIL